MSKGDWTTDDIPDLTGRRAFVTGATSGLGYVTALELLRHGAEVVVTARNSARSQQIIDSLREEVPEARVSDLPMDLANLASVRYATSTAAATYDRIDILVNNAGVMATPDRHSAEGFELQLATNHLGHFALTAGLWPLLAESEARIVSVSSLTHLTARGIDLRSLTNSGAPRKYRRWRSYAESKLATLSFALELDRRVRAAGLDVVSVAAHPGYASTNLTVSGPRLDGRVPWAIGMHQITRAFGQSARAGAWPLLMAATSANLPGGSYVGPSRMLQVRGRPQVVEPSARARDEKLARDLWDASEVAVGAPFEVARDAPADEG